MTSSVRVTTPSDREITVSRVFNAPARTVFDFHTRPQLLQKWLLGPPGWSMPVCEIDLKVGGSYHYVWRSDDGTREFGVHGEFLEIAAPQRLVHKESMDGFHREALCTATFVESQGRTTLTTTMCFENQEERDRALETGMTDGMSMSYDRMEEFLNQAADAAP